MIIMRKVQNIKLANIIQENEDKSFIRLFGTHNSC